MHWTLQDRGFLPTPDPLDKIPGRDFNYLEQLSRDLPNLVDEGRFQEYVLCNPVFDKYFSLTEFIDCDNSAAVERAFMLFSYLASAMIHSKDCRNTKYNVLPASLAKPLVRLAKAVGRPPILSYASYCLNNWQRIDNSKPIELGNIKLLQNFTNKAKRDEDWFILIHVDIEAKANDALHTMHKPDLVKNDLDKLYNSLVAMNKTLARMPEECSPEVYYAQVRPYIFGFANIVYEGCFDNKPQSFRGETGAQSSIVPSLLAFLGIKHKDSMLTKHLDDMHDYMPSKHNEFIAKVNCGLRDYINHIFSIAEYNQLKDAYNACVEQLIIFRKQHFDYAVEYIEKRVADPIGTGGTPYIKWLNQLIEETKEYLIK